MLAHAPWAGPACLRDALVLDLFAGSGAMGLEALSRGAAAAEFYEADRAARETIAANLESCAATTRARILPDALTPAPGPPAHLMFLDPPYGRNLAKPTLAAWRRAGRLTAQTLIVLELARADQAPEATLLAERAHGAGRVVFFLAG